MTNLFCGLMGSIDSFSVAVLLLKLTAVMLIVLMGYLFCARKSASFRHTILALNLVAFPLLLTSLLLPGWSVSLPDSMRLAKTADGFDVNGLEVATKPLDPLERNFSPGDAENPFLMEVVEEPPLAETLMALPAQTVFVAPEVMESEFGFFSMLKSRNALLIVWGLGALFLFVRLLVACWYVQKKVNRAGAFDDGQYLDLDRSVQNIITNLRDASIRLKVSSSPSQMPLAAGFLNKTILLPSDCYLWPVDQWQSVLMHEVGHIKRHDGWTNLIAQMHQAVLWFHPLAWCLTQLIRWECEKACDDFVIETGVKDVDYASVLLRVVSQSAVDSHFRLATVSMCEASEVESRMKSILSKSVVRRPVGRLTVITLLACISVGYLAIGTAEVHSENNIAKSVGDVVVDISVTETRALDFIVTLRDGSEIRGSSAGEIRLKTSFGEVLFSPNSIRRMEVKEGETFSIQIADGTKLVGEVMTENIRVETEKGTVPIGFSDIKNVLVVGHASPVAGAITDGFAANRMTYHVRAPLDYDPSKPHPAIVILHGSSGNSKNYIETIVKTWPDIAEDFLLIGINGENETKKSKSEDPRFNYTYVNFAGKSVYKGFPGTDRESPALVAEVIEEIKAYIPVSKLFVGGHSQGGFLTYSVMMNYPGLVDGAFPVSGGMIIQCDPFAYKDETIRLLQREIPLAIVHSPQDGLVDFKLAESAYGSFLDDGFPKLHFFNESSVAHRFAELPVDSAIRWLETMTTDDPSKAISAAKRMMQEKRYREMFGLMLNLSDMKLTEAQEKEVEGISGVIENHVIAQSFQFADIISANQDNKWIDKFAEFRSQFEYMPAAKDAVVAFNSLRSEQDQPAAKLFSKARKLFRTDKEAAYKIFEEIVDDYYASSKYRSAKLWLENRN